MIQKGNDLLVAGQSKPWRFRSPRCGSSLLIALIIGSIALPIRSQPPPVPAPPSWVHDENFYFPIPPVGMVVHVKSYAELALIGDPGNLWQEYEQAKQEFQEWFQQTKQDLEAQFQSASGDSKIQAAERLLRFAVEAEIKWEDIKRPSEGTWQGQYSTHVISGPLIRIDYTETGDMTLTLTPDGPDTVTGRMEGTILSGESDMEMAIAYPGQQPVTMVAAGGTWDAQALGATRANTAKVIARVTQHELDVAFGVPGVVVEAYVTEGQMSGRVYLIADLNRIYDLTPLTGPITGPVTNTWELPLSFALSGRDEILDLTELKENYCVQYIRTIDDVKTAQLGQPTHAGRRDKAFETLQLLTRSEVMCDAALVDLSVIDAAGLAHRDENSLYDKWFRLWFAEAMAEWAERIGASAPGSTERSNLLRDRFSFVIRTINGPLVNAYISEKLIADYGLEHRSSDVDDVYEPYYDLTLQLWLDTVTTDAGRLPDGLAWVEGQVTIAQALVSTQLGSALGLLSTPPTAEIQLRQAAGGT